MFHGEPGDGEPEAGADVIGLRGATIETFEDARVLAGGKTRALILDADFLNVLPGDVLLGTQHP